MLFKLSRIFSESLIFTITVVEKTHVWSLAMIKFDLRNLSPGGFLVTGQNVGSNPCPWCLMSFSLLFHLLSCLLICYSF